MTKTEYYRRHYGAVSLDAYQEDDWDIAMEEFQKLEDNGFGEASLALGQLNQKEGYPKEALRHFRKAAKAGIAEGAWGCAANIKHEYIADITGADKEWYSYCLAAAKGGCSEAMITLGNLYNRKNDYLGAYYWYTMASMYDHPGGEKSFIGTIKKYLSAGSPRLVRRINGVSPVNVKSAFRVFECFAAAYSGNPIMNKATIEEFFMIAAEEGNEFMGLFLGCFCEDFLKNDARSREGYFLAAKNDSIMGVKRYADMFLTGKGGARELSIAFQLYQKAAEKGEKKACYLVGELWKSKQQKDLAAYWFSAAIRRGYEEALTNIMEL